ncbi:hypothetical protein VTK56DRAFT_7710 [Thermocarpiscus australiensis]
MFGTTTPAALRAAGGKTWLSIFNGSTRQTRWLSTSPAHRAAQVITFTQTANPELKQILETMREKIILPTYLPPQQRKRMYNPKLKPYLQNDPITLEIDGVVHKFRYVNRVTDLPNTHALVRDAIRAMKTSSDFHNLPMLLEGCERANRKLDETLYPKMIRRAAMANCLRVIIDCIRAVERTGFKLDTSEKINELLVWIQKRPIDSGWDKGATRAALKQTQLVLELLEGNESHRPKKGSAGRFPFYRDPQVLAARLHMAAALAVHHQGAKDADGSVTKYAEELVRLWPEGKGLLDLQPDVAYGERSRMRYLLDRNMYLWYASPVLNGLTLAAQVVADPGLAMQLQNRADAVDAEIRTALASEKLKKGGRGEYMYNKLFNPQEEAEEQATAEETE